MNQASAAKEGRTCTISLAIGAGVVSRTIDPSDEKRTTATLNELLRLALAPMATEIAILRNRALSADEIQKFIQLLKSYPSETRVDGRPTANDLLVKKLEAILKS